MMFNIQMPGSMRLRIAALLAALLLPAFAADAEQYPDRPIRIICIHPVGITSDLLARAMAPKLGELLGQSIIIENRAGANGIIATGVVAKAEPDGYTMLLTSGSHIANSQLRNDLPFDPIKDFAPIINIGTSYGLVLITNQPVNSLQDLLKLGQKRPLSYATNGPGNTTHVAGLMLEAATKTPMNAVAYSTNSMVTDVISGSVDFMFVGTANAEPLVRAGQLKAFATSGKTRSRLMPQLPTLQEMGYFVDVTGYFGLLFPAGTPEDRVNKMNAAVAAAIATPAVKTVMDASDIAVVSSSPAEFKAFLEADQKFQEKLMTGLKLKAQ